MSEETGKLMLLISMDSDLPPSATVILVTMTMKMMMTMISLVQSKLDYHLVSHQLLQGSSPVCSMLIHHTKVGKLKSQTNAKKRITNPN